MTGTFKTIQQAPAIMQADELHSWGFSIFPNTFLMKMNRVKKENNQTEGKMLAHCVIAHVRCTRTYTATYGHGTVDIMDFRFVVFSPHRQHDAIANN